MRGPFYLCYLCRSTGLMFANKFAMLVRVTALQYGDPDYSLSRTLTCSSSAGVSEPYERGQGQP